MNGATREDAERIFVSAFCSTRFILQWLTDNGTQQQPAEEIYSAFRGRLRSRRVLAQAIGVRRHNCSDLTHYSRVLVEICSGLDAT